MTTQKLPGYPRLYVRKTLPLFCVGAICFGVGFCSFYLKHGQSFYLYTGIAGIAGFLIALFWMIAQDYLVLLPHKRRCPSCDQWIYKADEGYSTMIHYDCPACQIRWETGLYIPRE